MVKTSDTSFEAFLLKYKATLKSAFYERDDIERFSLKRGFPYLVFREIMAANPLSVGIESKYGGRGAKVSECLSLLAASSYESLPLSLTFGINIALFLEPVAKYGNEAVKPEIFERFLHKQNMGGLMITEPDFGSDALNMKTFNVKAHDHYRLVGEKHWQGLTGLADYWIITSRAKKADGALSRDIDFFITDEQDPRQKVKVSKLYNNIGLYPIPYGVNQIDSVVPAAYKLIPETTGLKMMIDTLHRSRLQFPGMAMGFIQRLLDESISHTQTRFVGGKPLIALDQVKYAISTIQSAFTVCSAMCLTSSSISGIDKDLSASVIEANTMKAYVTDLMFDCANVFTQLSGAKGYREESLGARGIVDARPFQIFEGSNEMLYTQIAELTGKLMKRKKCHNLYAFLKDFHLTKASVDRFKGLLNFEVEANLPQRKLVDLGRIISRVVSAGFVHDMSEKGFRKDLVERCQDHLVQEVARFIAAYERAPKAQPIEGYTESGGKWLDFA